jgi:hypothetical protein
MVCWLLKGMVERLFKRLSALLEAVRNAFAGRGFRTAEGVMRDAARGGIGRRGEGALAMPDTERYSVSNDDGQAKEAGDGRVPTDLCGGWGDPVAFQFETRPLDGAESPPKSSKLALRSS